MSVVWLYTELFYAVIPTLLLCFLLICYPYILLRTFLMFFSLVHVTFFEAIVLSERFESPRVTLNLEKAMGWCTAQ